MATSLNSYGFAYPEQIKDAIQNYENAISKKIENFQENVKSKAGSYGLAVGGENGKKKFELYLNSMENDMKNLYQFLDKYKNAMNTVKTQYQKIDDNTAFTANFKSN